MGIAVSGLKSESLECLVTRPGILPRLFDEKCNKCAPALTGGKKQLLRLPTWAVSLMNSSLRCVCEGTLQVGSVTLVFQSSHESTVSVYTWPLWSLRWYGSSADYFVFEAGRRCPSGPGQFLFRCKQAKKLRRFVEKRISKLAQPLEIDANPERSRALSQPKKDISDLEHVCFQSHAGRLDPGAHHTKAGWLQTMQANNTANSQEHEERYTSFSLTSSLARSRPSGDGRSQALVLKATSVDSPGPSPVATEQHLLSDHTSTTTTNNVDYLQLLSPATLSSESSGIVVDDDGDEALQPTVQPPGTVCYPQLIFSPGETNRSTANNNNNITTAAAASLSGGQYLIAVACPNAYINQPGGGVLLRQSPLPVQQQQTGQQEDEAHVHHQSMGVFRAPQRATSNVYVEEEGLRL